MATPTVEEFLSKARDLNPDYSDDELIQAYQDRYASTPEQTVSPKPLMTLSEFLPKAQALNPDYSEDELREAWQEKYGSRGARETEQGDVGRGFETAFKQLPQLASGVEAGIGATGEKVFGEGGFFTAMKHHGIKNYKEAEAELAKESKPSDSVTEAYNMARAGDAGALVDWLQYGLGYAGGQAVQMLATAGVGMIGGKMALKPAVSTLVPRLIAKEKAKIAATAAGASLAGEELTRQAVSNVAARIGQTAALATVATGMEGGEIYGDLVSKAEEEGRSLTGGELARALGATAAAGSVEFIGDKFGVDLLLGKTAATRLATSRVGNAIAGGTAGAVVQGLTEAIQTPLEQIGKGEDPRSPESIRETVDSAALGAVGGTAMGGVGGIVHRPEGDAPPVVTERPAEPELLQIEGPPPEKQPIPGEGPVYTAEELNRVEAVVPGVGRLAKLDPAIIDVSPIVSAETLDDALLASEQALAAPIPRQRDLSQPTTRTRTPEETAILEPQLDPLRTTTFEARQGSGRYAPTILPEGAPRPTQLAMDEAVARTKGVAPPESSIVPGQAFTPRTTPELTPKERLAQERARLVAMQEQRRRNAPVAAATPATPMEAEPTPLRTQEESRYPTSKAMRDLIHQKGFHLDTPVFREVLRQAVGKEKFSDLTPLELQQLKDKLDTLKSSELPAAGANQATEEPVTPPPSVTLAPIKEKPYVPVSAIPEAQVPRSELTPEKNAEVLLRAEKAKADMEIAGTERGGRFFQEQDRAGGTTEVIGLKSPTAQWYKDLTSGPSAIRGDRKQSAREKIEIAIQKIIQDQGADRGKAVEQVKAALLQDQEFRQTEWGRDLDSILQGEWPSWVEQPADVARRTTQAPGEVSRVTPEEQKIDTQSHEAATSPENDHPEPTQAQKEAVALGRGGARTKVDQGTKDEAVRLYKSGMNQEQVASELGISDTIVHRSLKEAGVSARKYDSRHNKKPEQLKQEAIRLYADEKKTLPEVAKRLNVGLTTVARWVKSAEVGRSQSEALAMASAHGRRPPRGLNIPWQSAKTGKWEFADSKWEAVRMSQLDADDDVKTWTKLTDRVPYADQNGGKHTYAPDFLIEYNDGRMVVEEIKPGILTSDPLNVIKASAAKEFFDAKGIEYRTVTEREIGTEDIESFDVEGFAKITEEERDRRRRDRRARAERERRERSKVDKQANDAATSPENNRPEPTDGQREAGNYAKGHVRVSGLDISIENPVGSERSGTNQDGKPWSQTMQDHYGYIKGTKGKDKDHLDVFIKPGTQQDYSGPVFVVDQKNPATGAFDEHKIVLGAESEADARGLYQRNYSKDWDGLSGLKAFTMPEFKLWLKAGNTKKPVSSEAAIRRDVEKAKGLASDSRPNALLLVDRLYRDILDDTKVVHRMQREQKDQWATVKRIDQAMKDSLKAGKDYEEAAQGIPAQDLAALSNILDGQTEPAPVKSDTLKQEVEKAKGAEPKEEPFSLTSPEVRSTKPTQAQPEQLGIDVPPPTSGSRPIIGREVTPEEAPLFSKAAQEPEVEQAALPEEPAQSEETQPTQPAQSPTEILANALRTAADQIQGRQPTQAQETIAEPANTEERPEVAPPTEQPSSSFFSDERGSSNVTGRIDLTKTREQLQAAGISARPHLLGSLGLEQISQVYGEDHAEVRQYNQATQAMEADFIEMSRNADPIIKSWQRLKIPVADAMARVMEEARFLNFDPDPVKKQAADSAKKQALRTRFDQLPADAKAVYRQSRDFYTTLADQRFEALKARIERGGGTPENTKKLVDRLHVAYDQVRSKVYFPFTRFGENIVVAKQMEDGKEVDREVHAFESVKEAQQFATLMKMKGWSVKQTVAREYNADQQGPASKIVKDMYAIIKDMDGQQGLPGVMDLQEQLLESLNQSFLQALPDMSYAKHFIHARDVKGFSKDALRSFAHSAFHGAHHISRIKNADRVTDALAKLDERINKTSEGDTTEARQVYNELVKRHNQILNPNTHPVSAWLGQLGFTMSLGGVVATGVTNAMQVPLITYPWMGARYGFGKASAALAKAYKDFLDPSTLNSESLFDVSKGKNVTDAERKMLLELARRGRIDMTQTMDLAGLASQDNLSRRAKAIGTAQEKVMRALGFTFHVPEVMNRQVTALATFRMEYAESGSYDKALQRADQAIVDTHFIYSAANRPRYMSGNVLRVLTMFKQYSQNIAYLYGRALSIWLDKNNATEKERTIAKQQLVSMLAMQFGAAGALGMPFVGAATDLIMAAVSAFGDEDDEKRDWEVSLRKWLDGKATSLAEAMGYESEQAREIGREAGEVISHGVSRLTPFDMAGRLGQNDLFFRTPQRDREGRLAAMDWVTSFSGPVAGYTVNAILGVGDMVKGAKELNAGFFMRGVEELTPAVLRNSVKALRYAMEDVRTRDQYKQLELDTSEKLGQAFGFTPARAAEMYESITAVRNKEHRILNERKNLLNRFARAVQDQDDDAKQRVLEKIRAFNERNPMFGLTSNSLNRSLKSRLQREAGMERGVYLPPKRRALLEEGDWADF